MSKLDRSIQIRREVKDRGPDRCLDGLCVRQSMCESWSTVNGRLYLFAPGQDMYAVANARVRVYRIEQFL
jgi:hypothetical protein